MAKRIFIDCGAHCGESILEAKRRFGDDIKIVSFEANINLHTKLAEHFKDDPNVTIHNKAAWTHNDTIKFHLSTAFSDGSSVYKEKVSGGVSENIYQTVQCRDVAEYINALEDYEIILKLDVEGAEYEILNHMIKQDVMHKVSEFHGEWHPTKIDKDEVKQLIPTIMNWFQQNNVPFHTWEMVGNAPKAIDRTIWKDSYEMPKITFVIPSRNNLEFLQLAYQSIRNLKNPHDILVLNDASDDGTDEWLDSLKDPNIIVHHNPGPDRIGIVGMFDKGIEMARTEIIMAFHADMIAGPNLDLHTLRHLERGTVVTATRVEPSLHPPGPEKIMRDWGVEVEEVDMDRMFADLEQLEGMHPGKITEGVFAPWCMYKEDFLAVDGHDDLFAPQSKEDSDIFNRFLQMGYEFKQPWDALVYHFTSRGSRFNKHAGGAAGQNSEEWLYTTNKNMRNFIRKWGSVVKHDPLMKPIVDPKYDIGVVLKNSQDVQLIEALEPWCSNIYVDESRSKYITLEQPNTIMNLQERVLPYDNEKQNGVLVEIDARQFNQDDFQHLMQLSLIIDAQAKDEDLEGAEFELGNMSIKIITLKDHTA